MILPELDQTYTLLGNPKIFSVFIELGVVDRGLPASTDACKVVMGCVRHS